MSIIMSILGSPIGRRFLGLAAIGLVFFIAKVWWDNHWAYVADLEQQNQDLAGENRDLTQDVAECKANTERVRKSCRANISAINNVNETTAAGTATVDDIERNATNVEATPLSPGTAALLNELRKFNSVQGEVEDGVRESGSGPDAPPVRPAGQPAE